jgi:hypothetical protein
MQRGPCCRGGAAVPSSDSNCRDGSGPALWGPHKYKLLVQVQMLTVDKVSKSRKWS